MDLADVLSAEHSEYRIGMMKIFDSYVHSEQWQAVMAEVKKRDNSKCVDCGKLIKEGNIGVTHHTRYDNWGKGNYEEIQDCVYLCKTCHSERHKDPEMRKITPFWAKRSHNLYASYYLMNISKELMAGEKKRQKNLLIEEKQVEALLFNLCALPKRKYKRDDIRKLVLNATQILYQCKKQGLINFESPIYNNDSPKHLTPEQVRQAYENRDSA